MLMVGPPGGGKLMLASAMPGILPRLTNVELTRIYSACGELKNDNRRLFEARSGRVVCANARSRPFTQL
jgi:predicted ATPase with chaperone activity